MKAVSVYSVRFICHGDISGSIQIFTNLPLADFNEKGFKSFLLTSVGDISGKGYWNCFWWGPVLFRGCSWGVVGGLRGLWGSGGLVVGAGVLAFGVAFSWERMGGCFCFSPGMFLWGCRLLLGWCVTSGMADTCLPIFASVTGFSLIVN